MVYKEKKNKEDLRKVWRCMQTEINEMKDSHGCGRALLLSVGSEDF